MCLGELAVGRDREFVVLAVGSDGDLVVRVIDLGDLALVLFGEGGAGTKDQTENGSA